MRWKQYKYYSAKNEGDSLGNFERVPDKLVKVSFARMTPWTHNDIEKYGRDVVENTFKLLARSPFKTLDETCEYVEVDNELLEIERSVHLDDRYFLALVKKVF